MKEQLTEVLLINHIIPARSWYYLYAYTSKGNIFIYAHWDRVEFFANNEADGISDFQDTVTKLTAVKYFKENSEKSIANIALINFEKFDDTILKLGTCLVTFNMSENFKADVWINNQEKTVEFRLSDAEEFKSIFDSDIILPD
jgi:hypothetical protein